MKKTSLNEEHKKLAATMAEFAGFEMPLQYTNLKQEVLAVRSSVGMFDVSHMGEFFISGEQVNDFINYMIPNDYSKLTDNQALYTPLCNSTGGVMDDVIIYRLSPNKALVCVNAANISKDWDWLNQNASNFSVQLHNASEEFSLLAIQGPKADDALRGNAFDLPKLKPFELAQINHNGHDLIVARTGYTGEDGYEIFADHESIKRLWTTLLNASVTPCGLVARDVLRIEACYPLYGNELSEELSPIDSGIKWTVKKKDEDFIGKKQLLNAHPKFAQLKLSLQKGIPRAGYSVLNSDGKKIGIVTSGTMSVTINRGIAMARVDLSQYNPQQDLFIEIRGKSHIATQHKKSFILNGGK